jgi:hypothetical protein
VVQRWLPGRAEQHVPYDRRARAGRGDDSEIDAGDAEQVGQSGASRPGLGDEGGQQEGGGDGVPQRPVRLAAVRETLDLRAQAELSS